MSKFLDLIAGRNKALESIGFDPASLKENPDALKEHVDKLVADQVAERHSELQSQNEDLAEEINEAATKISGLETKVSELQPLADRCEALQQGLAEAGVKIDESAEAKDIGKTVTDRISIKAGEIAANRGLETPVDETPSDNPADAGNKTGLKGIEATKAAFRDQVARLAS